MNLRRSIEYYGCGLKFFLVFSILSCLFTEVMFSSGTTITRLTTNATMSKTHKARRLIFFILRFEKKGAFFFSRTFFLNRPLRGEIEYSPVANLSNVS